MYIIVGYNKGESFVVGYTTTRQKAEKWVAAHPNGTQDEYDDVEIQMGFKL